MPVVTVPARPSGLPTAMTGSPTFRRLASPRAMALRSLGALVSLMTARSVDGSVPTTVAAYIRLSARVTVSWEPAPAPVTTWLLVRMWPFVSKMTPEPWPLAELLVTEMATTLGETAPAVTAQLGADGLACSPGDAEAVVLAEG